MSDFLCDYDYFLPEALIARHPPARREDARLMVIERATRKIKHASIHDLPQILQPHDCLVLNNTRVLPARLMGKRANTEGRWEGLYLGETETGDWQLLCQTRGKLRAGEEVIIFPVHGNASDDRLRLTLIQKDEQEGIWTMRSDRTEDVVTTLNRFGTVPLPPYMRRELAEASDFDRYQTTFARHAGSVAAPTAGLHFTPELLAECTSREIRHGFVTLHVGIGTFRPIAVENLSDHRMHSEWCELPADTVEMLCETRQQSGRIVAVGTTTTRTLESAARSQQLHAWRGTTDLFIRPPYEFQAVDCLLTNFHLPRSSLLVLVSAFVGRELIQSAYAEAIRENYRFYSYGDAMLIL